MHAGALVVLAALAVCASPPALGQDLGTITWDGGAGTSSWGDADNWDPDGVPTGSAGVLLTAAGATTINVDGTYAVNDLEIGSNIALNLAANTLTVNSALTQWEGTIDLGTGTLELAGSYVKSGGTLAPNAGTVLCSGTAGQTVLAATYYNLTLRSGGAGEPKTLTAEETYTVTNDLTVEGTAQLAVSAATSAIVSVAGNLNYAGIGGGADIGSLTLNLTGTGKTINGASFARPESSIGALPAPERSPVFDMGVTVGSTASYTLDDDISMGTGRLLTINGRLNCGTHTIGGGGGISVDGTTGVLGTATTSPSGLGATVLTTGTNTYSDGSIIEYNAFSNQTIHSASHPATSMLYTAGSGTKTLDANLTISGDSGWEISKAALWVAAGTTFADGGYRLSLNSASYDNISVFGAFSSTGSGSISYKSTATTQEGPNHSVIRAVDGTTFGDLLINFKKSTDEVFLGAAGASTVNINFRKIIFGGVAGNASAGGTLELGYIGTTDVTVTDSVSIVPWASNSYTGGGFEGHASTGTHRVTVLGNVTTTSVVGVKIMGSTGTNTFTFGGSAGQNLLARGNTTLLTGVTTVLDNAAGLSLGGTTARTYTINGTLSLLSGNITTGIHTLGIGSGGSLNRASGHIVGNLKKWIPTGNSVVRNFEIGTGSDYTPVSATFAYVTGAGSVVASTAAGDHAQIATSGLDPARTANRTWTLTNDGLHWYSTYGATLNFVPGDLDVGADPGSFQVKRYAVSAWNATTTGTRTETSTQATGLSYLGEFAVGQPPLLVLTTGIVGGGSLLIVPDRPAYDYGDSVQITANAGAGWQFDHWTGNASGSDNPLTVIMDVNKSITAVFIDVAPPEAQLTAPNGGEVWSIGTTHPITWSVTDNAGVTAVDLEYSTDGGATYPFVIAAGLADSGSYDWVIPDRPTTSAKVRLTAHDAASNNVQDESDAAFAIQVVLSVEGLFHAAAVPDQGIVLRWQLPSFSGGAGLRIYRALSVEGPYGCITRTPLMDAEAGTYVDRTAWPGGTFWYELRAVLESGEEVPAIDARPSVTVPGALTFGIRYMTPNPTRGGASIGYTMPVGAQSARLSVYDAAGRLVRRLHSTADARGGFVTVKWDGRGDCGERLVSGVYFVRLEVDGAVAMQKLTVLR